MPSKKPETQQIDTQKSTMPDLALLSHDIQSAVSDVIGGVRLVDQDQLPDEAKLQLERVRTAAELLARLVENALTAPGEIGQDDLGLSNLNLPRYLENLASRWHGRAVEKGLAFSLDLPKDYPATIHINRVVLDRILTNFLSNAMKFCENGRISVKLRLDETENLIFSILDDGPGFDKAALFNLFKRAKRSDNLNQPGQGLGMFIAHDLTVQLGAEIRVKNRIEIDGSNGACVSLVLPLVVWSDPSLTNFATDFPDLSGLKILAAEDSPTLQLMVAQMLQKLGAEFEMAADGVETINWLQRESFDLVLLDIEMPNMSGIDVLKSVRKMPKPLADIPMIAMTAFVLNSHREAIYAAGADGIIAKPLTRIERFGAAILRVCQAQDLVISHEVFEPDEPVISNDQLNSLLDLTDKDTRAELLRRIISDLRGVKARIAQDAKTLNYSAIRAQTHILIALAGAIGATPLQLSSKKLNQLASKGEKDMVSQEAAYCLNLLNQVISIVEKTAKEHLDE